MGRLRLAQELDVFSADVLDGITRPRLQIIKAGRLEGPRDGWSLRDQIFVIRANQIGAVRAGLPVPQGRAVATLIDLSKTTVLPGPVNCHTHLADGKYGERLKKSGLPDRIGVEGKKERHAA